MGPEIIRGPRPAGIPAGLDMATIRRERDRIVRRAEALAAPITRAIPVARALPIGGADYVVTEFRLGDVAEIQAYLEEARPNPLAGMPPAWADPDPATRVSRLRDAWEAASAWPVRFGSAEGSRLLAAPAGRAFVLGLALRPAHPGLGLAELLDLVAAATPAEWAGVLRVAYALSPREEIAAELAPEPGPGGGIHWARAAYRASQSDGGPSLAGLRDWPLSAWRLFCLGGNVREQTEEFAPLAKRARAAMGID